jgi:hypothetical protein
MAFMKWLNSIISEFCVNRCCKLGNSAFWEKLIFGRRPVIGLEEPPYTERVFAPSSVLRNDIELIEIRKRSASNDRGSRARIAILAVKAADSAHGGRLESHLKRDVHREGKT